MTFRETAQDPAMAAVADVAAPRAARPADAPLVVVPLPDGVGLAVRGEADLATAPVLTDGLTSVAGGTGDVHLDLSGLQFADVAAAASLVHAAARLGPGRALVLHSPPRCLRFALDRFWPRWPGLRVGSP